ncbi:immunity 52 family protein [Pyxidicoccus caerfyrddinensis]|uniref:immunity 52 family protein n=1 Tax=Pyxidicoccus caerfyrddinensis TaxID=2709663 RepID=UPI0013DA862A|nr:immunity 52 family protein [Pyxidicoccus caerfyrddinensis]
MTGSPEAQPYAETYYAGAYWGPRKESAEECARRAADFLNLLASCEPLLAGWNKIPKPRGRGRKTPLMPPDLTILTEAFRRGVNREPGGPAIEDLGLTVSAYNDGERGELVSLSMFCGSYARGISNACVLDLPWRGASAERLTTAPLLTNVVRGMASCWEPDWALAGSRAYRSQYQEPASSPFSLNWLTYLSHRLGRVPPLPAPVRIEPIEDRGTLIILTPERFTMANPEHVTLVRRVRELLARAGLLQPR